MLFSGASLEALSVLLRTVFIFLLSFVFWCSTLFMEFFFDFVFGCYLVLFCTVFCFCFYILFLDFFAFTFCFGFCCMNVPHRLIVCFCAEGGVS